MDKKFAPTLVVIIFVSLLLLWFAGIVAAFLYIPDPAVKTAIIVFGLIIAIVIIALLAVLFARFKEIDEEDENDLSQY